MAFRSGFVSIIGRPNAGKSTLLNALLGQKLAIVTHKPQTTRTRIHGVLEVPLKKKAKGEAGRPAEAGHPAAQVVLVDTPGVHKPETQLDRRMMQEVHDALESRDAVLFLVDATHRLPRVVGAKAVDATHRLPRVVGAKVVAAGPGEAATGGSGGGAGGGISVAAAASVAAEGSIAAEASAGVGGKKFTSAKREMSAKEDDFALSLVKRLECPVILVLNKIDAVKKVDLLPLIAHWSGLHTFAEVVLISARKSEGLDVLLDKVVGLLPEGQRYFPKHQVTDQPERFLVAELIREKILMLTGEEVPYSAAVVIERYEEPESAKKMKDGRLPVTKIAAAIICERTGQKAILIGKGGEMLKRIGTGARKEIEGLLGTRVFLELFVKVQEEWRSSRGFVDDLDWRRQMELLLEKQMAEEK